jgi:uncharacterized SAM-binding protein YcdF (DUF218 family)
MRKVRIFLIAIGSCFAIVYFAVLLYVGKNVLFDNKIRSGAILVLGAKSYMGSSYNPCLEARVAHASDLYKQGFAKKIIMSGGTDKEDQKNEALTMKEIAQGLHVPEKDIILEKNSQSTYENILFSKKIMQNNAVKSVIIVTEPFHSPRAALIAKKDGLDFSVSPTLTSQCWQRWTYGSRFFLREPFAVMYYFLKGRI